jgi:ABC-type Zn uptake system ZnuABC Zn-binding protein ZnuA
LRRAALLLSLCAFLAVQPACGGPAAGPSPAQPLRVLAVETFLADMAQNVAGERLHVEALLPLGVDPHSYEPTPGDVARVVEADVIIVNGAGLEGFIDDLIRNAGGEKRVIVASEGLVSRTPQAGEVVDAGHDQDPHFWLDPNNAIRYVENISAGLSQADPAGGEGYAKNAANYISQLHDLDSWIAGQVAVVPAGRRLLVTNHESLGYYADRYGFQVVGAIVPSVSTGASPSAQQLADLVDRIRVTGASVVFLETGTNPQLADQLAQETGVRVVTGLFTHSVSAPDGPAPTYMEMMRYDTRAIVEALAQP